LSPAKGAALRGRGEDPAAPRKLLVAGVFERAGLQHFALRGRQGGQAAAQELPALGAELVSVPAYLIAFLGLACGAGGGTLGALGAAVPGREATTRAASRVAVVALLGAALLLLAVGIWNGTSSSGQPPAPAGMCFRQSLILSVLPLLALGGLTLRGWVARPAFAAGLLLAGATALGALLVHLACGYDSARHLLMGHVAVPFAAVAVFVLPLAWCVRRFAR
jgi:hypothetical protein